MHSDTFTILCITNKRVMYEKSQFLKYSNLPAWHQQPCHWDHIFCYTQHRFMQAYLWGYIKMYQKPQWSWISYTYIVRQLFWSHSLWCQIWVFCKLNQSKGEKRWYISMAQSNSNKLDTNQRWIEHHECKEIYRFVSTEWKTDRKPFVLYVLTFLCQ